MSETRLIKVWRYGNRYASSDVTTAKCFSCTNWVTYVRLSIHRFWRVKIPSISSGSSAKLLSELFSFRLAQSQTFATESSPMHETYTEASNQLAKTTQLSYFNEEAFLRHRRIVFEFEVLWIPSCAGLKVRIWLSGFGQSCWVSLHVKSISYCHQRLHK